MSLLISVGGPKGMVREKKNLTIGLWVSTDDSDYTHASSISKDSLVIQKLLP